MPSTAFAIRGPVTRADLPGLCARVCDHLASAGTGLVECDVGGIAADAVSIDALARLQLAAQRHGCTIRLREASPELVALVAFLGLCDVLPA